MHPTNSDHPDWQHVPDAKDVFTMCQVVTELNVWNEVEKGFDKQRMLFDHRNPAYMQVAQHPDMRFHSGASFGAAFSQVHWISVLGWDTYIAERKERNGRNLRFHDHFIVFLRWLRLRD